MSQAEFIGMLVICLGTLGGVIGAIYKPITKNTETMTKLTATMEHLIERMDDQEERLKEHELEFEKYKQHVSDGQRRQWKEINKQHDLVKEHDIDIRDLKGGVKNA